MQETRLGRWITGDLGLISGSGRYPGEENGNPLQYSCLGNPMGRQAWWATVYGVTKSQTWLSACVCTHTHSHTHTLAKQMCLFAYMCPFHLLSTFSHLLLPWAGEADLQGLHQKVLVSVVLLRFSPWGAPAWKCTEKRWWGQRSVYFPGSLSMWGCFRLPVSFDQGHFSSLGVLSPTFSSSWF